MARIPDETVAKIRQMRSESKDDGTPKYSHKEVAEATGVNVNSVSLIARNKTRVDENYTPVHDGKRDLGPRKPKEEAEAAGEAEEQAEA